MKQSIWIIVEILLLCDKQAATHQTNGGGRIDLRLDGSEFGISNRMKMVRQVVIIHFSEWQMENWNQFGNKHAFAIIFNVKWFAKQQTYVKLKLMGFVFWAKDKSIFFNLFREFQVVVAVAIPYSFHCYRNEIHIHTKYVTVATIQFSLVLRIRVKRTTFAKCMGKENSDSKSVCKANLFHRKSFAVKND